MLTAHLTRPFVKMLFGLVFMLGMPFYSMAQEVKIEQQLQCDGKFKDRSKPDKEQLLRIVAEHSKMVAEQT